MDTPALVVDIEALEKNLGLLASFCREHKVRLRPHFKSHKCTAIARKQLEHGACGITCAKLSEAEVLAAAGVEDIFIANQVVGDEKITRLVRLAAKADIKVAVDSVENIMSLSSAAKSANVRIGVLVEVDIGMGRCGVQPGKDVVSLVEEVLKSPGLDYMGLQGYEGQTVGIDGEGARKEAVKKAMGTLASCRDDLAKRKLAPQILSGGATATYKINAELGVLTELQCGSYALMDSTYKKKNPEFENALSVLVTVISRPREKIVILDTGMKAISVDMGPPLLKGRPGDELEKYTSEEHSRLRLSKDDLKVGDTLELIPSHGCTTCNLHRKMFVRSGGKIVDCWEIEASGVYT